MERKTIRNVVNEHSVGNSKFKLLLAWGATVSRDTLSCLPDNDQSRAADIVIGEVNKVCGTSVKRVDLEACGTDYWKTLGNDTNRKIETAANLLKTRLQSRAKRA